MKDTRKVRKPRFNSIMSLREDQLYYTTRDGIKTVDLRDEELVPKALILEGHNMINNIGFIKRQDNLLIGVTEGEPFQMISFDLSSKTLKLSDIEHDFYPIAMDVCDEIVAVLCFSKKFAQSKENKIVIFERDLIEKEPLCRCEFTNFPIKSGSLRIHPPEEPIKEGYLFFEILVLENFSQTPQVFELSYKPKSTNKWKLKPKKLSIN